MIRPPMAIRVFISYSHDSPEHMDRVWNLSERLRGDGIDCVIDQHEAAPEEGWAETGVKDSSGSQSSC